MFFKKLKTESGKENTVRTKDYTMSTKTAC